MIIDTELTIAMIYKIIMIEATIEVTDQMLGENKIMVTKLFITAITPKENHNYNAYHQVREAVSVGVINME